MERKILLIFDKDATKGSRFDLFKSLINSTQNHTIRILLINYKISSIGAWERKIFVPAWLHTRYDFAEMYKLNPARFEMFMSKKPLEYFATEDLEEIFRTINDPSIHFVNENDFFIECFNSGYEIYYV